MFRTNEEEKVVTVGWGRRAPVLGDHPKVDGTTCNLAWARLKEGLLISLPQRLIRARSRSQRNELSRTDSSTLLLSGRAEWVGMSPEMLPKCDGCPWTWSSGFTPAVCLVSRAMGSEVKLMALWLQQTWRGTAPKLGHVCGWNR